MRNIQPLTGIEEEIMS